MLIHRNKPRESGKIKRGRKYFPNERTRQNIRKTLLKLRICNLPGKEFEVM